jgi:hypothetical protein
MTINKIDIEKLTIVQLVGRFSEIALAMDKALLYNKYDEYNNLYDELDIVDNELCSRGEQARLALTRLYQHPNRQVRLKAAKRTLAVAPVAARNVLESIVAEKWHPQALDAGVTLSKLDDGSFKPV